MSKTDKLRSPPAKHVLIESPAPHVLLVTIKLEKQMRYTESLNFVYSSNVIDTAGRFTMLILSSTLLPQRMNAIRNLQMLFNLPHPLYSARRHGEDYLDEEALWERNWEIFSSMKGLCELWVAIRDNTSVGRVVNASKILHPLKAVRGLEVLDVKVLWSPEGNDAAALGRISPSNSCRLGISVNVGLASTILPRTKATVVTSYRSYV